MTSRVPPATVNLPIRFWLFLLVLSSNINGFYCKKNKRSDLGATDGSWKLVKIEPKEIGTLSDLTNGIYSIKVSGGRSQSCGLGSGELIGFNNRTCSVSLSPRTTAGPVMREASKSQMWREWMVRVEGGKDAVEKKVTLQAFVDPDVGKKAKCLGYMSTFYGNPSYPNACSTPPYGTGVFLNGTKDLSSTIKGGPQVWSVRAVAGSESQGDFELHASSKPEESCARVLSLDGCQGRPTLSMMGSSSTSEGSPLFSSWKFIKQYDLVSTAPPPTPPSPTPSVVGPPFIPGPVISGPSTTSSGYVTVTIKETGGGNGCSVGSIVLTSTGGAIGSVPATVEVSSGVGQSVQIAVKTDGYNSIYAVGVCTSGVKTEISNGLSVFSSPDAGPRYDYPLTFTLVVEDGYTTSNQITDADKRQICINLLNEVPGGVCEVVNSFLVKYSLDRRRRSLLSNIETATGITITARYTSNSSATELFEQLDDDEGTIRASLVSGLSVPFQSSFPDGYDFNLAPQIPVVTTINVTDSTWTGSWADTWYKDVVYIVSCSTGRYFTEIVNGPSTIDTFDTWTGMAPDTTYYCSVGTRYPAQYGDGIFLSSNYVEIKTLDIGERFITMTFCRVTCRHVRIHRHVRYHDGRQQAQRVRVHSSLSKDGNDDSYDFTYQGSDGRKKATFENAFKSGVHGTLRDYVDHAPWEFGYQMAEKNLVWHDDLKDRLYARVASEELNITEEELVGYLDRLRSLMPDASEKLANMPIKTLSRLIKNIDTIPEKLMRLKMIFPKANASLLAIRNPELVLGFDSDHLQTIADVLNDMFPKLEVDKLVEENPSMLDIEELHVAMAEAQRIMPNLDVQKAMGSDPQLILSFQRGSQLIPYDPVSPEERQRDEDEYNQYYT